MNLKGKKKCTYAVIVLYNLSIGVGYAIIFPTIWNYVHLRYGGDETMLGLVISAYSISSFFANLLIGWLGDKTQNTKVLILLTMAAEVCGSLMYFVGISNWFLLISRLVSGFGGGGGAVIVADISRTTTEDERTSVLAMVVSSRQLGFLVGPALMLFLSKSDCHLGPLPVDKYTSPGLFMALLWSVISLLTIFLYSNLTELKEEEDVEQLFPGYNKQQSIPCEPSHGELESSLGNAFISSYPSYSSTSNTLQAVQYNTLSISVPNLHAEDLSGFVSQTTDMKVIPCRKYGTLNEPVDYSAWTSCNNNNNQSVSEGSSIATDNMIETAERFIQSASELNRRQDEGCANAAVTGNLETTRWFLTQYSNSNASGENSTPASEMKFSFHEVIGRGFLRDEVVVLLGLSFISCFAQTVLETMVTPLTQKLYEFTEWENSLTYLFCGIEVIVIFIALRYISHKVPDRWLLLFGSLTLCIATALPLAFVPSADVGGHTFPYFVTSVILDLIGIAVIVICSASLLSKVIDNDKQAFAQGVRRSMVSLGCILGPLWGGGYFQQPYALFAVPLCLSIFITVLLICSFKRMKPQSSE